jgi:hypothetical protein
MSAISAIEAPLSSIRLGLSSEVYRCEGHPLDTRFGDGVLYAHTASVDIRDQVPVDISI